MLVNSVCKTALSLFSYKECCAPTLRILLALILWGPGSFSAAVMWPYHLPVLRTMYLHWQSFWPKFLGDQGLNTYTDNPFGPSFVGTRVWIPTLTILLVRVSWGPGSFSAAVRWPCQHLQVLWTVYLHWQSFWSKFRGDQGLNTYTDNPFGPSFVGTRAEYLHWQSFWSKFRGDQGLNTYTDNPFGPSFVGTRVWIPTLTVLLVQVSWGPGSEYLHWQSFWSKFRGDQGWIPTLTVPLVRVSWGPGSFSAAVTWPYQHLQVLWTWVASHHSCSILRAENTNTN